MSPDVVIDGDIFLAPSYSINIWEGDYLHPEFSLTSEINLHCMRRSIPDFIKVYRFVSRREAIIHHGMTEAELNHAGWNCGDGWYEVIVKTIDVRWRQTRDSIQED